MSKAKRKQRKQVRQETREIKKEVRQFNRATGGGSAFRQKIINPLINQSRGLKMQANAYSSLPKETNFLEGGNITQGLTSNQKAKKAITSATSTLGKALFPVASTAKSLVKPKTVLSTKKPLSPNAAKAQSLLLLATGGKVISQGQGNAYNGIENQYQTNVTMPGNFNTPNTPVNTIQPSYGGSDEGESLNTSRAKNPSIGNVATAKSAISPSGSTSSKKSVSGGFVVSPKGSESPFNNDYNYSLSAEERALRDARRREKDYYDKQANERIDRDQIMRDTLRQFQGEIDATNRVYADKLSQARLEGADRLGSTRAENFNAGAINSSFGNAANERTLEFNRTQESAIQNEKLALLGEIESSARTLGQTYYEQKKLAKEQGLESYMNSLLGAKEAKLAISTDIANNILNSGLDFDEIAPKKMKQIAKDAGVSFESIKDAYAEAKKLAEAEALQAEQDALKAEREGQFNLSEGQARYDSEGNLIASRSKTYKPESGSGYTGTVSSGALALAQQIQNGTATLAQVPSKMRAEVAQALNQLPNPRVQELDDVISTIDELSTNPKLDNILGPADQFVGGVFGQAATAKNLYKQLVGTLALEGRSKLKGSGAISDFEFKVLKEAQSALGRNLTKAEFMKQLNKVKTVLNNRKNLLQSQNTSYQEEVEPQVTIEDYRLEFPNATDEELQALLEEEQAI